MRITLDTDNKIVTLLHEVNFKDVEQIKKIIGDGWRDWKILPYPQTLAYPWIAPYVYYDYGTQATSPQPLVSFTAQ